MPQGSCFCGKVKIAFTGEPMFKALCWCGDCRKISGGSHSVNLVVPADGFTVTGAPKEYTTTADSGKKITSYFCGDCGTTLFRSGEASGPARIIKAGVLDDANVMETVKPTAELYVGQRPSWEPALEGAAQMQGMT